MKVRCAASVSPILWKGGRESVVQRGPLGDREAMLLGEFFFFILVLFGKLFIYFFKIVFSVRSSSQKTFSNKFSYLLIVTVFLIQFLAM